ncbi:hypothetical protein DNK59_15110 [Pseudomonas sp. TKO26]|uniref:hypothetical protein n=1 Tax=unclassified Pseudomonas TaxID=196821 RepID=UPI000D8F64E2|nr:MULTISPECIES: hypothetical protein [unclassified Pseudomonas]PYY85293.1 hypothetical protein DNK62_15110 [Pseudomonas sp. TKO30]PYY87476.1 hypothetical protein DNK61_15105 [Pseudomonas sp. TKO29]PYY90200.1 hypothetical protein DNK59_15110 [Pseudomonas sp. TKO26]PYY99385.1 hypothetical protein DNK60_15105 [Pseudomonas sp. TKO14]
MKWLESCGLGLALCAGLGGVTAAQAGCDNTTDIPGELHVCKPWPAEPELSISARATPRNTLATLHYDGQRHVLSTALKGQ